jgi:hypothetical protein
LGLLAASPALASAAQSRPYTGVSIGRDGASGAESFGSVASIAVDQSSGDVYVYDSELGNNPRIYKFDPAGAPVNFSSTGTNSFPVGPIKGSGKFTAQITVAPAGSMGGTEGDVYLVGEGESGQPSVQVYAPSGTRLGAFGPPNGTGSARTCGVTTDSSGRVIVATGERLSEYAPSTNPPTDGDFVQAGPSGRSGVLCSIAFDGTGGLYAVLSETSSGKSEIYRFDEVSDANPTRLAFSPSPAANPGVTLAADPVTGGALVDDQGEVVEYATGGSPELGTFAAGQISESVAVAANAAADEVYVADRATNRVKVFGSPVTVPTATAGTTSFSSPVEAKVTGSVDPEGITVTECFVEYGLQINEYEHTSPCESVPPSDSEPHPVSATITELAPDGVTYHYRLVAANASGVGRTADQTFTTPSTVQTGTVENLTETTATLTGRVFPNKNQYTECEFEYELVSEPGLVSTVECAPKAGEIAPDSGFHRVTADLTGLQANNVSYRVRLKATTAQGTIVGNTVTFSTSGDPLISEVRAADADQHSATLEATIEPSGFKTAYRIEWGPTESYGTTAISGSIEPGEGPTRISAPIGSLAEGTTYHYRVFASNASAHSPDESSLDREFETLNECGLPQGRCFELTSEREAGPVASPGHAIPLLSTELISQAAERSGALAYVSESGYPGATRGAEVLYRADRGSSGWTSTQLAPPITVRDEQGSEVSNSSRTLALSPELTCGVVETNQPLPGTTTRMSEVLEAGGTNLYRLNPDGSYTPISTVPPENLLEKAAGGRLFHIAGMSPDCSRIYFLSAYRFPGTQVAARPSKESPYLYEWKEGRLQAVGVIPGGASPAGASPGNDTVLSARADRNSVSEDGSRIFFTAKRVIGNNPSEVGTPGLFVREDGTSTRDVSLSETAVADTAPQYQWATPDGSQVFFTAPAGLTTGESNATGTDLYAYDLTKSASDHPLKDLSVNHLGTEAGVVGMVGASNDGSRVYFAATERLVAGEGLTRAENASERSYSLYLLEGGRLRFVATVKQPTGEGLLLNNSSSITSEVSSDGRYLVFESIPVAGTGGPAGLPEAYLFDAEAPQEAITCVSCMPRGRSSKLTSGYRLLSNPSEANGSEVAAAAPRALVMNAGRPSVVFSSLDPLAPEATEGQTNLFEWSHNQVFLFATESLDPAVEVLPIGPPRHVFSLGSSADGSDIYLTTSSTPKSLAWEHREERSAVYDARIGGGFAKSAAPSPPCDPTAEGQCQGSSSSPPGSSSPQSSGFVGPGNPKPKKCKKGQTKKHGKCVKKPKHKKHGKKHKKHGKKHKGSDKKHVNGNRGAGK